MPPWGATKDKILLLRCSRAPFSLLTTPFSLNEPDLRVQSSYVPFDVLRASSEACEMSRRASTRVLRRSRYWALMPGCARRGQRIDSDRAQQRCRQEC